MERLIDVRGMRFNARVAQEEAALRLINISMPRKKVKNKQYSGEYIGLSWYWGRKQAVTKTQNIQTVKEMLAMRVKTDSVRCLDWLTFVC